jgi:hypothetical protein
LEHSALIPPGAVELLPAEILLPALAEGPEEVSVDAVGVRTVAVALAPLVRTVRWGRGVV